MPCPTISDSVVGKGIRPMFSCCPPAAFTHSFVRSSGRIFLPRYLMNGLGNLDETHRGCSLAHFDDLLRFWMSKVKVTAGCRGGEGIHVKVKVHLLVFRSTLKSRPNKTGLKCPSVHPSVHKTFLRFQWNLACRQRSMSDARRYAVWPDPRPRSR